MDRIIVGIPDCVQSNISALCTGQVLYGFSFFEGASGAVCFGIPACEGVAVLCQIAFAGELNILIIDCVLCGGNIAGGIAVAVKADALVVCCPLCVQCRGSGHGITVEIPGCGTLFVLVPAVEGIAFCCGTVGSLCEIS